MAVVIRLTRCGKNNRPYYRVVAADSRFCRDGRFLERLGHYDPLIGTKGFQVKRDRVDNWIKKGAEVTPSVKRLLRASAKVAG